MAGALAAVDVQDLVRQEAGRLEVYDRVDNIGDLALSADWVQGGELRIHLGGMHRRLDRAGCHRFHPNTTLGISDRERFGRGIRAALCQ